MSSCDASEHSLEREREEDVLNLIAMRPSNDRAKLLGDILGVVVNDLVFCKFGGVG